MRRKSNILVYFITVILIVTGCDYIDVEPPVWINEKQELYIPLEELQFLSSEKKWEASLFSFAQPIPLIIQYSDTGFVLTQKNKDGVIEGPAKICLTSGEKHFFYEVNLVNQTSSTLEVRDYRSPKTVNPDSSLTQQKIIFAIDKWRNVVQTDQTPDYFEENEISIPPKAGIYRAQTSKPISSYYVQPGSCTSIPIKAGFNPEALAFNITAGPLKDKYDNIVADGTIVSFIYSDAVYTYQVEASLQDGYATVLIPADAKNTYSLIAKVNETKSKEIQLQP